jgi:hypothetical protein
MVKEQGNSCKQRKGMRCGNDENHRGLQSWFVEAS